ncbi:MAG: sigma-54-dependent Fis family transcriptional regulator [Phycisphaerales bacterium]|nr:sigma-54-dependent Fis family transcriptional regulator [Phycisphaerales bacterium]
MSLKLTENAGAEKRHRVLVVDDDPIVAESMAEFLRAEGLEASTALDGQEALQALAMAESGGGAAQARRPFAVVISDVAMPTMDGMQLLQQISEKHPSTVVLMLTGYGTIENAVKAVRLGAADYLTKPVIDSELRIALERALRQHALQEENRELKQRLQSKFGLDAIIGSDARMTRIYDLIEAVAPTKTTVLMTGESGTGKSLIAHAIHHRSPRASKPFVELACGSIPETLLESELFGHVKGSFTGAHADKVGKFLAADGGTIFLDEINSASPGMQLKLLRVLQERKFEPVGSNQTVEVDCRVILASNQPLEDLVAAGRFRQDLYYRINVVKIELPPLRERVSDIPMLAEHFLKMHSAAVGRVVTGIDAGAMDALRRYAFPGNVRELGNIIERAVVLARRPTVTVEDLPPQVVGGGGLVFAPMGAPGSMGSAAAGAGATAGASSSVVTTAPAAVAGATLEDALREPEKRIILEALRASGNNKMKAAEKLGINRTTLYKKMRQLGIDPGRDALAG